MAPTRLLPPTFDRSGLVLESGHFRRCRSLRMTADRQSSKTSRHLWYGGILVRYLLVTIASHDYSHSGRSAQLYCKSLTSLFLLGCDSQFESFCVPLTRITIFPAVHGLQEANTTDDDTLVNNGINISDAYSLIVQKRAHQFSKNFCLHFRISGVKFEFDVFRSAFRWVS
jgi:hypothetical protein